MRRKEVPTGKAIFLISSLLIYSLTLLSASAQEIGHLDLTGTTPGHRVHEPTSGSVGGVGGGCDHCTEPRKEALRIELISLDGTEYRIGEDLTYEVKIENASQQPLIMPWDPNVADVEPKMPNRPYQYRLASISLWFTDERRQIESSQAASLYGTSQKASSLLTLRPGEWVRMRAKVRLSFHDPLFVANVASSPHQTISVRAVCTLDQAQVTLRENHHNEDRKPEGPPILSVNTKDFQLISSEESQPNQ